jgi:hypothetical protein
MSSLSNPPKDTGKASGKGGKVGTKSGKTGGLRHAFHRRDHSHKRSSSLGRSENTPFLDGHSGNDDVEAQRARDSTDQRPPSQNERNDESQSRFRSYISHMRPSVKSTVQCLSRNCCIIILACILAAATIALGVYFGCMVAPGVSTFKPEMLT